MSDETRISQGSRLAAARQAAGFRSSRAAALENGWPESTYRAHEAGTRTIGLDDAEKYVRAFQARGVSITAPEILFTAPKKVATLTAVTSRPTALVAYANTVPDTLGARDLPVFASSENGDGIMTISTDPVDFVPRPWYLKQVKEGYAITVTGRRMEPAYYAGDLAIVNPKAALVKGKDVLVVGSEEGGQFKASLNRYLDENAAEWLLEQHNPGAGEDREFRRFKHDWPRALRVVGKYDGG